MNRTIPDVLDLFLFASSGNDTSHECYNLAHDESGFVRKMAKWCNEKIKCLDPWEQAVPQTLGYLITSARCAL